MKSNKLIAKIRATKGPIYVDMIAGNDTLRVQVVKSDLIAQIRGNELTMITDDAGLNVVVPDTLN